MKIAYLGYDLSCLKADSFFKKKKESVTYFLTQTNSKLACKTFQNTDLYTENLMMSPDVKQQTDIQKKYFDQIKNNYKYLESQLSTNENFSDIELSSFVDSSEFDVQNITRIIDIHHDSKTGKVMLELDKHGVEEFDFILIEQNSLIKMELEKKNINIFNKNLKTETIWTTLYFDVEYLKPIKFQANDYSFFLILDSERDTVIDNWFHCVLDKNSLCVSGFQPYTQLMNPGFQVFISRRIQNQVADKLKFITIKKFIDLSLSTVSSEYSISYNKLKPSAAVPNFSFWSDMQINGFLSKHIYKKINKININNAKLSNAKLNSGASL
ncbi:MAG: hypothetical protein WA160_03230 [Pseudobdellovibrio sp.]